jgi:hypothetical protein
MAFPSNPVNNQTTVVNGISYTYSTSLGAWSLTSINTGNTVAILANTVSITNTLSVGTTSTFGGDMAVTGNISATGNITSANINATTGVYTNGVILPDISTVTALHLAL